VTESATFTSIRRVTIALKEKASTFIAWPTGERLRQTQKNFEAMKGVKGVIGAIDGSHRPSIVLQAVCDEHKRFTDCYTGWPGSVHDARVFQNSDLSMRIQSDPFVMFPEDTHLLGDAAYPLTKFMLTPYKDNGYLTEYQKAYNYKQSATTICDKKHYRTGICFAKGKIPKNEVNKFKL